MILSRFGGYSGYGGLQIVPSQFVPVVRGMFATQGIGPEAVSDNGEIDPQALIALAFDKVEVRTAFTPTLTIDMKGPSDPATAALLNEVKPHIVLKGRAGSVELAPYGVDVGDGGSISPGMMIVLGLAAGAAGLFLITRAL